MVEGVLMRVKIDYFCGACGLFYKTFLFHDLHETVVKTLNIIMKWDQDNFYIAVNIGICFKATYGNDSYNYGARIVLKITFLLTSAHIIVHVPIACLTVLCQNLIKIYDILKYLYRSYDS